MVFVCRHRAVTLVTTDSLDKNRQNRVTALCVRGKMHRNSKVSNRLLDCIKDRVEHEQELNHAGIYCITNERNGHKYVGQSKCLCKRKENHFRLLKCKKHHNPHLQRAWNYYGGEWFSFAILEIVRNYCDLDEREQYWIERLHPDYNIVKVVGRLWEKEFDHKEDYYNHGNYQVRGETFTRPEWHKWVYGGSKRR